MPLQAGNRHIMCSCFLSFSLSCILFFVDKRNKMHSSPKWSLLCGCNKWLVIFPFHKTAVTAFRANCSIIKDQIQSGPSYIVLVCERSGTSSKYSGEVFIQFLCSCWDISWCTVVTQNLLLPMKFSTDADSVHFSRKKDSETSFNA